MYNGGGGVFDDSMALPEVDDKDEESPGIRTHKRGSIGEFAHGGDLTIGTVNTRQAKHYKDADNENSLRDAAGSASRREGRYNEPIS